MSDTLISQLVSVGGLIIAFAMYIFNTNKSKREESERQREEAEKRGEHNGKVASALQTVNDNVNSLQQTMIRSASETNCKIDGIANDTKELRERVAKVEESAKSAHKRIDEITKIKEGA